MMESIGQKLKAARLSKGLTQLQLADELFVTRQTVSNWENNRSEPDLETISRLAVLLDVELSSFFGQEAAPVQEDPPQEDPVPLQEMVVQPSPAKRIDWRYAAAAAVIIVLLAGSLLLRSGKSAINYSPSWFQAPAVAVTNEQALLDIYIRPNNSEVTLPNAEGRKTWPFALVLREKNGIGAQVELIRVVLFFADGSQRCMDYDKDLLATKTQTSHIDRHGVMRLFMEPAEGNSPLTGVGFHVFITDDKNHQMEFRHYAHADQL